jgi:hypothetical protein
MTMDLTAFSIGTGLVMCGYIAGMIVKAAYDAMRAVRP